MCWNKYCPSPTNIGICLSLPPVFALLLVRCPPAVFRRVSFRSVDPVYCQAVIVPVRQRPRFELRKASRPLVTQGNSTPPVPLETRNLFILASAFHVLPNPIEPGLLAGCERSAPVLEAGTPNHLVPIAPTTDDQASPQCRCMYGLLIPAIAPAKPHGVDSPIFGRADNCQSSEFLSGEVNLSWHHTTSIRSSLSASLTTRLISCCGTSGRRVTDSRLSTQAGT